MQVNIFHHLGRFWPLYLQTFFCTYLSLLSWHSHFGDAGVLEWNPRGLCDLFIYFFFFVFPLIRLENLNQCVFKLADSFFLPVRILLVNFSFLFLGFYTRIFGFPASPSSFFVHYPPPILLFFPSFFLIICFIDDLHFVRHYVIISFNFLYTVSFISLGVFMIATL